MDLHRLSVDSMKLKRTRSTKEYLDFKEQPHKNFHAMQKEDSSTKYLFLTAFSTTIKLLKDLVQRFPKVFFAKGFTSNFSGSIVPLTSSTCFIE